MTGQLQVQLVTRLVALDEVEGSAVKDVYHLLVDDCGPIRHAAAALVADSLEEHGARALQVGNCSFVCWRRLHSLTVTCRLLHDANTLLCRLLLLGTTAGSACCGPGDAASWPVFPVCLPSHAPQRVTMGIPPFCQICVTPDM